MLRRKRTAKGLGQRHDFFYFKKWTKGRLAKTALAIALPAIGALWLLGAAVTRNNVPYSAGHLASAHEVIGKNCQACHEPEVKVGFISIGFRQHVSDKACLNCHQAPKHQNNEVYTPGCSSCHIEHVASPHLERTADSTCTQCHGDLKVKSGAVKYAHSVEGFNANHPEFAVLRDDYRDPGTIKLNHQVHMKKEGLVDGRGNHVELECSDCHRTPAAADRSPWKYGNLKQASMSMTAEAHDAHGEEEHHHGPGDALHQTPAVPHMSSPGEGRELMMPVNYARNCAQCHTMQFNEHIAESVPHDEPQVIHEFITKKLTEYVAAHPQVVHDPILSGASDTTGHWRRRYMKEGGTSMASTPGEWVKLNTVQAEQLLWRKTCAQCHSMQYSAEATGLPAVAEPQIKVRWLQDAMFSHYAHTGFSCESCHTKTMSSIQTGDVLIPSIKTCQECHSGKPTSYGVAENGCFICHQYHNWKEPRGPMNPDKNIQDLLHGSLKPMPRPMALRPAVAAAAVPPGQ